MQLQPRLPRQTGCLSKSVQSFLQEQSIKSIHPSTSQTFAFIIVVAEQTEVLLYLRRPSRLTIYRNVSEMVLLCAVRSDCIRVCDKTRNISHMPFKLKAYTLQWSSSSDGSRSRSPRFNKSQKLFGYLGCFKVESTLLTDKR